MAELAPSQACAGCGTELTPALLACPSCHRLVHAETLKGHAAAAEKARAAGDVGEALRCWRQALELLPPGSRQHQSIVQTVASLSSEVERGPAQPAPQPARGAGAKGWAGLGALALLLWKFKAIALFAVTKGKLLLLGFTKASTVFSMALSLGVYWSLWGWKFALGFIAAMYVHEMGHVAALRRYGIPASAPMFIPGVGAFVRLRQHPSTVTEDARVGLAGPLWGAGATLAAFVAGIAGGWPSMLAIEHTSAWLNLFNLLPLGSLDGGRGFRSLTRTERWMATGAIGVAWFLTAESLLVLLLLCAAWRSLFGEAPAEPDRRGLALYIGLIAVLSALALARPDLAG